MNLSNYMDAWNGYKKPVRQAEKKRDKTLARLEGYEGKRVEAEREQAWKDFNTAVEAARAEARAKFDTIIRSMHSKASEIDEVMTAPTTAMLNTLQALSMKTSISQRDADAAARMMDGCDVALDALQDLCTKRGGVRVSARGKTARTKAFEHVKAFQDAAGMLLSWQGGTRNDIMLKRSQEYYAHIPETERTPLSAAFVADVEGTNVTDFCKAVVSHDASMEDLMKLD